MRRYVSETIMTYRYKRSKIAHSNVEIHFFVYRIEKKVHVAINTRLMQNAPLDGIGRFSFEIVKRVAEQNRNDKFTLIFDRKNDGRYITSPNMHGVWVPPPTRLPFLMDLFFEASVPYMLNKLKPDVFFSPDGWISMRTQTPTVQVVHDLNFIHMPEHLPPMWRKYYLEKFPRFIEKADHIITVSEFSKQDLIQQLAVPPEKISVVYNETGEGFRPGNPDEITDIRKKYTDDKPYFLFVGLIHPRKNIGGLMNAFALYKKKNKDEVKLVIAGNKKWWTPELENIFAVNAYKNDIVFTGRIPDSQLHELYRGALALVYPSFFEGFGIPILEAFKSGIPVITANNTALPEVGGNAALYADAHDADVIAEHMSAVTGDHLLRDKLIQNGFAQSQKFSWDTGAVTVSQILHRYA